SGRRDRQLPADRIDMPALFAADLIPPLGRMPQRKPLRVTEPVPNDQPERLARAQRVPDLVVAGQAALDTGGIQQDGEPTAGSVPQFMLRRQERAREDAAVIAGEPHLPGGVALAHRRREPDVEPQEVDRYLVCRRA